MFFAKLIGINQDNVTQLLELGYNRRGLGLSFTGRRIDRMVQKIYSYTASDPGYGTNANMLSYRPAMSTQYTYMLTTLNPYSSDICSVHKNVGSECMSRAMPCYMFTYSYFFGPFM